LLEAPILWGTLFLKEGRLQKLKETNINYKLMAQCKLDNGGGSD
jgi:hypothetical protein